MYLKMEWHFYEKITIFSSHIRCTMNYNMDIEIYLFVMLQMLSLECKEVCVLWSEFMFTTDEEWYYS